MTREERIKQIEERVNTAIYFSKGENMLGWEVREYVKDTCTDIPFLLSELKKLEAENARLRVGMVGEALLQKENAELREQANQTLHWYQDTEYRLQSKLDKAVSVMRKMSEMRANNFSNPISPQDCWERWDLLDKTLAEIKEGK